MRRFLRSNSGWVQWLLAALVETAVLTPWVLLLYAAWGGDGWAEAVPGAWLMLLLFLAACLWESAPWARHSPSSRPAALLAGVLAGYLAAYALLPAEYQVGWFSFNRALTFVPVAAYLWFQGARARIAGLDYGHLIGRFPLQFAGQFAGILLLTLAHKAADPGVQLLLYWSVFLLFTAGLSLLVLVRSRRLEEGLRAAGESAGASSATPVTTFVVLLLALMTVVASLLLSVDGLMAVVGAVFGWLSPFFSWLLQVVLLIVARWAQLLELVIRVTVKPFAQRWAEQAELSGDENENVWPEAWTGRWAEIDPTPYVAAALIALFVAGLAFLLIRLSRTQEGAQAEDEERMSLGFWRSLWADLRSLVEPMRRKAAARAGSGGGPGEGHPGAARRIYREFQRWGAGRGRARRIGETPNRYQEALAALWPGVREAAARITAMYNQARYGPAPPGAEAVEDAREALARLKEGQP